MLIITNNVRKIQIFKNINNGIEKREGINKCN